MIQETTTYIHPPSWRQLARVTLLTSLWVHASEVFRYFAFVMPAMQAHFSNQPGIAEMDLTIFLIWGVWDTVLSFGIVLTTWLFVRVFGDHRSSIVLAASFTWLNVFVIFWLGSANMGTAAWSTLGIALPLSWLELVVAAWIAAWLFRSASEPRRP